MAFADPQSVTIDGTANSLARTSMGTLSGAFETSDGLLQLEIQHQEKGRTRHLIKLSQEKQVSDPLIPAQNIKAAMSCHLVIDVPPAGYTNAEVQKVVAGLTKFLTDGSGAAVGKLLGNES